MNKLPLYELQEYLLDFPCLQITVRMQIVNTVPKVVR